MDLEKKLRANIPKVLLLNFFYMFLVLIPVIVPYWQMHRLSMSDVYLLQSVFAITVVILEIPSGYISDLLGRKNAIVVAGIFSGLGFQVFLHSATLTGFIGFEVMMAISTSLVSGTDVALVYDSIEQMQERRYSAGRILGKKVFYAQLGETIAALIGGAAAAVSLVLPAQINAVTSWGILIVGLTLFEPPRQKMDRTHHRENFTYIYLSLFRHSRLLTLIVLNLIVYGLATLLAVWAFQGYWQTLGIPLGMFGYLWAGYNLTVALTGRLAHRIEKRLGSPAVILLVALLPVMGYLGMAAFSGWVGILLGISFQISRGLNQVVLRDALNSRVQADMRATANSVASMGVRLSFAAIGPLLGWIIDDRGYPSAFYVMAALFAVLFLAVCLPLVAERRNFKSVG